MSAAGQLHLFSNPDDTPAGSFSSRLRPSAATANSHPTKPRAAKPLRNGEVKPFHVSVLGSGSGGNSTVVRYGEQAMLIDAGFGPRTIAKRLEQADIQLADLSAICLTHLDQDHFRPTWLRTLLGYDIKLYLHHWHRRYLDRIEGSSELFRAGLVHLFDGEEFQPIEHVHIKAVRLPHDDKGTSGFLLDTPRGRAGYATDLGHVPDELVESFIGIDMLLLESNYDPQMQLTSSRPRFLKQRIMGKHGHLSNEQAFETCQRLADLSPHGNPQKIVLLHRSAQCNCAEIIKRVFAQDARFEGRVQLTHQRRRTRWMEVKPLDAVKREQMALL